MTAATVSLQYVAAVRYGLGQPPRLADEGIPILRATNITRGKITEPGMQFTTLDALPAGRGDLLDEDEILVVRSGAYTGDSARVGKRWAGSAPGYDLRLTPDPEACDSRFLAWALLSDVVLEQVRLASTRAAQAHLNAEEVGHLKVPLPALDDQRRVADMLDVETSRVDELIAKNNRVIKTVRRYRDEAVARAVTEGIDGAETRPVSLGWSDTIAEDWATASYQYVATIGTGHTPSRSNPDYWVNTHIPWITTGDVKHLRNGYTLNLSDTAHSISSLGLANSAAAVHPKGTVVLSRTASVGFSAVMGLDMATSQDFVTWTCDGERLRPEYLLFVLRAMKSRGLFDRMMFGSTHNTIYFDPLRQLSGPLPPVAVQDRIVARLKAILPKYEKLEKKAGRMVEVLATRRKSLITAAVTGQITV